MLTFLTASSLPGLSVPNVHGALAPLAIPSAAAAAAAAGRIAIPGLAGAGNSVLLVSNLNPEVRGSLPGHFSQSASRVCWALGSVAMLHASRAWVFNSGAPSSGLLGPRVATSLCWSLHVSRRHSCLPPFPGSSEFPVFPDVSICVSNSMTFRVELPPVTH